VAVQPVLQPVVNAPLGAGPVRVPWPGARPGATRPTPGRGPRQAPRPRGFGPGKRGGGRNPPRCGNPAVLLSTHRPGSGRFSSATVDVESGRVVPHQHTHQACQAPACKIARNRATSRRRGTNATNGSWSSSTPDTAAPSLSIPCRQAVRYQSNCLLRGSGPAIGRPRGTAGVGWRLVQFPPLSCHAALSTRGH